MTKTKIFYVHKLKEVKGEFKLKNSYAIILTCHIDPARYQLGDSTNFRRKTPLDCERCQETPPFECMLETS